MYTFSARACLSFYARIKATTCLDLASFGLKFRAMLNPNLLKPPVNVRNMLVLDRTKFTKTIKVPYVKVGDSKISEILPGLKKSLLKIERFQPIADVKGEKVILLDPNKIETNNDSFMEIELKYENYSAEDILRAVLPNDKEGSASFTKIGHIVHVNLREHLLPYKTLIGQVLLDKVTNCKTVVNKIDSIDNTYRNFQMEVLSGDENFLAQLKENGCRFEFDFSKVYWNSRLCTEHERIVKLVQKNDVMFDVFAGVGPFSVPASKKGNLVYANDLNPDSFKWLEHNKKINKIGSNLEISNKDGREFILNDIKLNLLKHINKCNIHIVMNLPALAVSFLDAFRGLYTCEELNDVKIAPILYVYCFAKGEDYELIARELVRNGFGGDFSDEKIIELFRVRTVSSMKEMMRVTVRLDADILIKNKRKCFDDNLGGALKKSLFK